jgi:hypothetical protein
MFDRFKHAVVESLSALSLSDSSLGTSSWNSLKSLHRLSQAGSHERNIGH